MFSSAPPYAHPARPRRPHGLIRVLPALLLAMLAMPTLALAELTASMSADRSEVGVDQRFTLHVEVTTDSLSGPEVTLPDLSAFQVLSQSMKRPMQMSFGLSGQQVRSSTQYDFALQPRSVGEFTIAPVVAKLDGQQVKSQPLTIRVVQGAPSAQPAPGTAATAPSEPAAPAPAGEVEVVDHGTYVDAQQVDPEAFIRTVVDTATPYEGEQVTVTMYLYTAARLQTAPRIEQEPTTEGLWTQDLLQGTTLEEVNPQQVRGRRYRVYVLRRFAAFPLRAGELTIGPMSLVIDRPRNLFDMFGRGGPPKPPLDRAGVPLTLRVKPLPEQGRPKGDVAVGTYSIDARLDRTQTATGDAVTMTATLSGVGQIRSARLHAPEVDGLQVLQPEVRDLLETDEGRIGGTRVFEWLVVPQRAGTYQLPPLTLQTFDPASGQYATVKGPALTITAAGRAVQPAAEAPAPAPTTQENATGADEKTLTFGPIRSTSALSRGRTPISREPWFPWAAGLPWLIAVGLLIRAARTKAAKGVAPSAAEQSRNESEAQLEKARVAANKGDSTAFYPHIAASLTRGLEFALGQQIGSYTRKALLDKAEQAGLSTDSARGISALLDRCDAARFAPGADDRSALHQVLQEAERLQRELMRKGVSR